MVAVMSPLKMPTQRRLAELGPVMRQSQVNPSILSYAKVCQGFQTRLDITQLALAKKTGVNRWPMVDNEHFTQPNPGFYCAP